MRALLIVAGLLLTAVSGLLYINFGGWVFLLATFAGMGTAMLGMHLYTKCE